MSTFLIFCIFTNFLSDGKVVDWLITDLNIYPKVTLTNCSYGIPPNDFPCIELSNSLISRKFIIEPNFFTVEYNSYLSSDSGIGVDYILRSPFSPESIIGFNYKNYSIGGVSYVNNSNTTAAFWNPSWLNKDNIIINDTTWLYDGYTISSKLNKLYEWTPGIRHSFKYLNWPPIGLQLTVSFKAPLTAPIEIQNYIKIKVVYELYQGMPILSKQIIIESSSPSDTSSIYLTYIQVEQLKTNIPYGLGESDWSYWSSENSMLSINKWNQMNTQWGSYPGYLYLLNDYAHLSAINWFEDPDKKSFKTNNYGGYEPIVTSSFIINDQQKEFAVRFDPTLPGTMNGVFKSFRTFELIFSSYNFERQSLGMRRLMTYMSPTLTEAPIYAQTVNMTNASVHRIIDQCAESGFELLTFSFDSGFNMFTDNQTDINYYHSLIEYGKLKGIEIGGYNLEDGGVNYTEYNRVEIDGSTPEGACFASGWVDNVTQYIDNWISIGATMFITDGPYPGWSCNGIEHKYHDNLSDSTYRQIVIQQELYLKYRNQSIYMHSPDPYYFYGINRNKYQYDEFTTTLPRWWDLTIYRQLMYDESYIIPTTAGWMFLPLKSYHQGDSEAVFEPLSDNIADYSFALGQYFSYSVAATIRGDELWDNNDTRQVVINWVNYYKKYRQILMSDIIHISRPNNQNIDAILHVNHLINPCGMLIVFNPLNKKLIDQYLEIDLYYTGAKNSILIAREEQRPFNQIKLIDLYHYTLNFNISARNLTYWIFNCSTTLY